MPVASIYGAIWLNVLAARHAVRPEFVCSSCLVSAHVRQRIGM